VDRVVEVGNSANKERGGEADNLELLSLQITIIRFVPSLTTLLYISFGDICRFDTSTYYSMFDRTVCILCTHLCHSRVAMLCNIAVQHCSALQKCSESWII